MHCNALQHTATHFNTLQCTAAHCTTLHHTATHCSTLQHTGTHCNTLQHTATHCNTLRQCFAQQQHLRARHTATLCNTLQHTCNTLQHSALHCNTLQPTATHYNPLQHTTTHNSTYCKTLRRRWAQQQQARAWPGIKCCRGSLLHNVNFFFQSLRVIWPTNMWHHSIVCDMPH